MAKKSVSTITILNNSFSKKAEYVSVCSGKEDLKFLFGFQDKTIQEEKKRYIDPVAFTVPLEIPLNSNWGKGIIWFSPPRSFEITNNERKSERINVSWKEPQMIDAFLIHEIGHVFGNGHVENTIMREDILGLAYFAAKNLVPQEWLNKIDHTRELVICEQCSAEGHISNRFYGLSEVSGTFEEVDNYIFKLLTDRQPQGKVRAKIDFKDVSGEEDSRSYKVTVTDELGSEEFALSSIHNQNLFIGNCNIFRTSYVLKSGTPSEVGCLQEIGMVLTGDITIKDGTQCIAIISRNIDITGPLIAYLRCDAAQITSFFWTNKI